mgnify:FL=1
MRFRHRCALERTSRHLGYISVQRMEVESLTTKARSRLSLQGVNADAVEDSNLRPIRVNF